MDGALTALGTVTLSAPDAVLLKADLQTLVGRRAEAARTLRMAIRADGGTEATWLALAALSDPGAPRLDVLREALTGLPASLALRVGAATEWLRTGNRDNARSEAELVLRQDPTNRDAWMVRADVVRAASAAEASAFATRLMKLAPQNGGLVLAVADHVAGLVRSSGPELPRRLASSLRDADGRWFPGANARMTVARLFAAVEDWTPALSAVQQALADAPDSRPAQRLRADILGWSGRHEESLAAYDRYLAEGPMDWDAARQRARVAGWAGMYARARTVLR
ncbi:MAG: hypothetical protein U0Q55_02510 [Vicinamibacterales bacterium]